MSPTQLPNASTPPPRNPRTKTGCLCCRLRRKKCDEARPVCQNCIRNNLICSWPRASARVSSKQCSDLGWRIRLQEGVLETCTTAKPGTEDLNFSDEHSFLGQWDLGNNKSVSTRSHLARIRSSLADAPLLRNPSVWEPAIINNKESQTLLSHFIDKTAAQLVAREPLDNPLLSYILPWAQSEPMIMDAIMALGGAHVSHKTGNQTLNLATIDHYLSATRKLKYALTTWSHGTAEGTLRLLAVALLLCQYEAVTCSHRSVAFYHLRASREFISTILTDEDARLVDDQREIFGFLLELYTYIAIVGNVTTTPTRPDDVVGSDWFVRSLQHLQAYRTFGSMLGRASELYELIPDICQLYALDEDLWALSYDTLEAKIIHWSPSTAVSPEASPAVTAVDQIYQLAVLAFLYSAGYVKDRNKDQFCRKITPIIAEFRLLCGQTRGSPARTTMLWPLMVIGSCLTSPDDQQKLCSGLSTSSYDMAITQRALQIVKMTWDLQDEDMFGPIALEAVMKRHDFCMS